MQNRYQQVYIILLTALFASSMAQNRCYRATDDAMLGFVVPNIGDLSKIDSKGLLEIRRALLKNGVIVLRNQKLSRKQQEELSSKLGELIILPLSFEGKDPEPGMPAIHRVTNYWRNGTWKGKRHCFGCYWHKDGNYLNPDQDYITGILHTEQVSPSSSGTGFLDNCKVVSLLTEELIKKIQNTTMTVSVRRIPDFKSGSEEDLSLFPDEAFHDIFYKHQENGRTCLYLTSEMITRGKKSKQEMDDLNKAWKFMSKKAPKYVHKWENGDVVMWDNVGVMHMAMPSEPTEDPRML